MEKFLKLQQLATNNLATWSQHQGFETQIRVEEQKKTPQKDKE